MDTDSFVKAELTSFLKAHSAEASINCIDEIVLSYMVSILEELGSEAAAEDAFDIDQFTEMMDAYLPGFASMNSVEVTEWMFALSAKLQGRKRGSEVGPTAVEKQDTATECHQSGSSEYPNEQKEGGQKRTHSTSEREDASSASSSHMTNGTDKTLDSEDSAPEIDLLMEMFPCACRLEIAHCLAVSKGNVEQAAQLILHRQDAGESIQSTSKTGPCGAKKGDVVVDDKKLKQSILNKYSFIDTHEDKVEHRPVMPKTEPKKLIRYLDNKIVTTKGERFVEIKKDDDAEVVKKTTVNLKPARQYRFH